MSTVTNEIISQTVASGKPRKPGLWRSFLRLSCVVLLGLVSGCTSVQDYVRNGFKVGPNYRKPPAPVADKWIGKQLPPDVKQENLPEITTQAPDLHEWWAVFNDPILNELIETAYRQNLDLRIAGTRILEARALRNIAAGNLFPQSQQAFGGYDRVNLSGNTANPAPIRFFDNWQAGLNVSWEVDFWGRFRRAVEAGNAELDASVENYDDVLVLLLAEVAGTYVEIRTFQKRIKYAGANIDKQEEFLDKAMDRYPGVADISEPEQQRSNVENTKALLTQLQLGLRQANNRLCVLLGIPPRELIQERLGTGPIPTIPKEAVVSIGIPVDLIRRRPDVRRSERQVAAQSARIGIATADLYPRLSLIGSIGWEARDLDDLFTSKSLASNIGPSFRWDILNYGRILNSIRVQDARFQQEVLKYQSNVLRAGREVEDALIAFVQFQIQSQQLGNSAKSAMEVVKVMTDQIEQQKYDTNRAFVTTNFLAQQQDRYALAQGNVALSLIGVYKALGGGWQIRLADPNCDLLPNGVLFDLPPANVPQSVPEKLPPPVPAAMMRESPYAPRNLTPMPPQARIMFAAETPINE